METEINQDEMKKEFISKFSKRWKHNCSCKRTITVNDIHFIGKDQNGIWYTCKKCETSGVEIPFWRSVRMSLSRVSWKLRKKVKLFFSRLAKC